MRNMKRFFKIVAFLFIFGVVAALLSNYGIKVNAADAKYIEIVTGTGKNLGDEVKIGDEHFFILSNNGNEIRMLAKYNVDISVKCTYNYQADSGKYTDQPAYLPMCGNRTASSYTSLQDASISGVPDSATGELIGVPFASETKQGTTLQTYKGSVVEMFVNEYVGALNSKYGISVTGDLLDNSMFLKLFYQSKGSDLSGLPNNIKNLLTVTFWTKVTASDGNIIIVDSTDKKYFSFLPTNFSGVRPVIIAPASALNEKEVESVCDGSYCFKDNDGDGKVSMSDEICIIDECFYVLSNENNRVKLLAKYNLNTGLTCSSSSAAGDVRSTLNNLPCTTINNTNLRQSPQARGYVTELDGTISSYGGVVFNSVLPLVNEYVDYINSLVDVTFTGSLVTIDEIASAIGEDVSPYLMENNAGSMMTKYYYLYQINKIPDWLYANSYWTSSTLGESKYAITSNGYLADFAAETTGEFGVRPLLTVAESDIPSKYPSACYICGDELVWSNQAEIDSSSCSLKNDITDANSCVNNPTTGLKTKTIQTLIALIIISIGLISVALMSRFNRFKNI